MKNVVIVEDRLLRGISLTQQFQQFSIEHPDLDLNVIGMCYFVGNISKGKSEVEELQDLDFEIKVISLYDFFESMNKYYDGAEETIIIMDFMLEDDGSEGIAAKRVNIRYAKKKGNTGKIWFYTGTGPTQEALLKQLVGDYVLEVQEVDEVTLHLYLDENAYFMEYLQPNNVAV